MPKRETIGSGITEYSRTSIALEELQADPGLQAREFGPQDDVWKWQSYVKDLMDGPVAEYLTKIKQKPGKSFREYHDPEWFAWRIWIRWHDVERRVKAGDANTAAMDAIELGMLVIQFLHKLDIEPDWQWGRDKRERARDGGRDGAKARWKNKRPDHQARVAAVQDVLARRPGMLPNSAFDIVAKERGETSAGIRKSWRNYGPK